MNGSGKRPVRVYVLNERRKYQGMIRSLTVLHAAKPAPEWVAITCLIACYIDAVSAGGRKASRNKYQDFLKANFSQLCDGLGAAIGNKANGAKAFWAFYRSGLAHTYFTPDARFALAEDHELDGKYAGRLETEGPKLIGINVERLYRDFLALARSRAKRQSTKAPRTSPQR